MDLNASGMRWLTVAVVCLGMVSEPLRAQSVVQIAAESCADNDLPANTRVIAGIVRDGESGQVLVGARVIAATDSRELSATADSSGAYAICGVAANVAIDLYAEYDSGLSNRVTLRFDDDGVNRTVRDAASAQSAYQPMTGGTWIEELLVAQIPVDYSSPARIGFKFGVTSSTVTGAGISAEPLSGLIGGLFYEDYGRYIGWRVEGTYVRQGAYSPFDQQDMTLHYFRLPVLAALRTSLDPSRFFTPFVLAGPAFGFDTRGNRGVPKGDLSIMFGGGMRINAGPILVVADATYGLGMTSITPPVLNEPAEFQTPSSRFFRGAEFKNRVLSVSIGLSLRIRPGAVGFGGGPLRTGTVPPQNIISREEIEGINVTTAYEVIERLHPQWLRSRGQVTMSVTGADQTESAARGPVVYLDRTRRGDIEDLRSIPAQDIAQVLFYSSRDASFQFGSGHGGGVIQLITR